MIYDSIDEICVFDIETTGVDIDKDRIVTAFVGLMGKDGEWKGRHEWLVNPGVDIPVEASNVHGITTEASKDGVQYDAAIAQIETAIRTTARPGVPLVAFNAAFDLSILHRDLCNILDDGLNNWFSFIIDPFVIDKGVDKYRKGSRKLVDVCAHYGVPVEDNAHDAGADCLMTGRLAWKIMQHPSLRDMLLSELHQCQIEWKAEQAMSLQLYLRRKDPSVVISGDWPYKGAIKYDH